MGMVAIDPGMPREQVDTSGESSRWIVLACYIATILLVYGAAGSVGAIVLTGLATAFWWVGFGRDETHFEPIAIGNAVGIYAGLAVSFLQIALPVLILVVVVLTAAFQRARFQRQPLRQLIPGVLSLGISLIGAIILGQVLPTLPF
jgi:hypothetical protein